MILRSTCPLVNKLTSPAASPLATPLGLGVRAGPMLTVQLLDQSWSNGNSLRRASLEPPARLRHESQLLCSRVSGTSTISTSSPDGRAPAGATASMATPVTLVWALPLHQRGSDPGAVPILSFLSDRIGALCDSCVSARGVVTGFVGAPVMRRTAVRTDCFASESGCGVQSTSRGVRRWKLRIEGFLPPG